MAAIGTRSDADIILEDKERFWRDLDGAILPGAILQKANLSSTSLRNTKLSRAMLLEANLTDENLTNAHLIDAHLIGANLTDTDLTGADLTDANLTGAKLFKAKGLTQAQLNKACAYRQEPPELQGVLDAITGVLLTWENQPPPNVPRHRVEAETPNEKS